MSAAEQQTIPSAQRQVSRAEYEMLARNYKKLRESLELEKAKSSKLRRYIARLNQTPKPAANTSAMDKAKAESAASMQNLVKEQGELLEKLYRENQEQQAALERVTGLNQHLLVANEKLRSMLLTLKRKLKPQASPVKRADPLPLSQRLAQEESKLTEEKSGTDKQKKMPFNDLLKELKNGFCKA